MLYALLMAAIFSLLLQFYLRRQVHYQRIFVRQEERLKAYAMALLSKEEADKDQGQMEFEEGKASYQREGDRLVIKVEQGERVDQFNCKN